MYVEPKVLFKEYKESQSLEDKIGKLLNWFNDNQFLAVALGILLLLLILFFCSIKGLEISHWLLLIGVIVLPISAVILIKKFFVDKKLKQYPDYEEDREGKFKNLMEKYKLNQDEEYLMVLIKHMKQMAKKTEVKKISELTVSGVLLLSVWSNIVGIFSNNINLLVAMCFFAVIIAISSVNIFEIITILAKKLLNKRAEDYKQFAQKLESYYYVNKFKDQPKAPDFTLFSTHPFKWRYTATKGIELKLKNKAKENLTISFNETELNLIFAYILRKQPVDLANEKRRLENEEYTDGIGYFIKDILNKEESIKVTKYLVALLESKHIIKTNGSHNKIKISLDIQVFNWQTSF